ncbi:MAG: hypothetical protein ACE5OZ_22940 [Candidatus Heimdallarchaeota archaeon]
MNEENVPAGTMITEGTIITIFADKGPENVYNSSPLDDGEAFSMVLKNLTAIGTNDVQPLGEITSHGPLPTPTKPYLSLAFLFLLKARESSDPRIAQFGRVAVFWIITRSTVISKYTNMLKRMIQRLLHFYRVDNDSDLLKEDIMKKIDAKLKIIEGGAVAYFITEENTVESFLNLALIPLEVPILLIDDTNRQVRILLREEISAIRKTKIRQTVNDYLKKIAKDSTYKFEWVSDPLTISMQLSKLGFESQTSVDDDFEIRLYGELTFEELDDFLSSRLVSRRRQLVNRVLQSIESKIPLNLQELAVETGMSAELIEQLLVSATKGGLIPNARIENGIFSPSPEE